MVSGSACGCLRVGWDLWFACGCCCIAVGVYLCADGLSNIWCLWRYCVGGFAVVGLGLIVFGVWWVLGFGVFR